MRACFYNKLLILTADKNVALSRFECACFEFQSIREFLSLLSEGRRGPAAGLQQRHFRGREED